MSRTGLHDLAAEAAGRLEIEPLDITDEAQIARAREHLAAHSFDVLFVNAGVTNDPTALIGAVSTEEFVRVMITNVLAPMRVIESFADLVPPHGTIAAMSSGLGSVSQNTTGSWEVYRASKAALNTCMRSFAARDANETRSLLVIAPGWVRTDMGGSQAPLSVEESIPAVVDTIAREAGVPGVQYLNYLGRTVPW